MPKFVLIKKKHMTQQIPQHRALMYSDFGVRLRRLNPSHVEDMPVTYAHQDDYYIIGMMERGTGCGIIDFKEVTFSCIPSAAGAGASFCPFGRGGRLDAFCRQQFGGC